MKNIYIMRWTIQLKIKFASKMSVLLESIYNRYQIVIENCKY